MTNVVLEAPLAKTQQATELVKRTTSSVLNLPIMAHIALTTPKEAEPEFEASPNKEKTIRAGRYITRALFSLAAVYANGRGYSVPMPTAHKPTNHANILEGN